MERSVVSQSICRGIFLGSNEKVITGGNAPGANVQVLFSQENSNDTNAFVKVSDLYLNGICADLELCGIPRLAQTFAAVALMDPVAHCSSVSMVNIETYSDTATLSLRSNNGTIYKDNFNITSISFCSDLELMAVGTEAGFVTIVDLYSGQEVSKMKVDPSGISKVKFMRTGQLITVGDSSKVQIKVWDLKSSGANEPVMTLAQQLSDGGVTAGALRSRTTCVAVHPVQEKLVSGTSSGLVHLWDLRSAASIAYSPHALDTTAAVTDVLVHPRRLDTILSSAADGTVRSFDSSTAGTGTSTGYYQDGDNMSDGGHSDYRLLYADPAHITSMDCDNSSDTCMLLATSLAGGVARVII